MDEGYFIKKREALKGEIKKIPNPLLGEMI
jgi:hypothetical protein